MAKFLWEVLIIHWHSIPLKAEWKSYGIVIGEVGDRVRPVDLLARKDGEALKKPPGTPSDNWKEPFYKLMIAYRMVKVRDSPDSTYMAMVLSKLMGLGSSCKRRLPRMSNLTTTTFEGVMMDEEVKKIIAAIDKVLYHHSKHLWTFRRAGTLVSRFRESMALTDVSYMGRMCGLDPADAAKWLFDPQAGEELLGMFATEDDVDRDNSYLPYLADLDLVTRSSYSATARPSFHNWVHIVGALFANPRSLKSVWCPRPVTDW